MDKKDLESLKNERFVLLSFLTDEQKNFYEGYFDFSQFKDGQKDFEPIIKRYAQDCVKNFCGDDYFDALSNPDLVDEALSELGTITVRTASDLNCICDWAIYTKAYDSVDLPYFFNIFLKLAYIDALLADQNFVTCCKKSAVDVIRKIYDYAESWRIWKLKALRDELIG